MENEISSSGFTNEESYRLQSITEALGTILKNTDSKLIHTIAQQEFKGQKEKRDFIDKQFQNMNVKTINDSDCFLVLPKHGNIQMIFHKGDIRITRNIHDDSLGIGIDSTQSETISSSDLLQIDAPTGIKIGDKKTGSIPIEIIPIAIAWKKIWQIWIGHHKDYFYAHISEVDGKIGIVANEDWYLVGEYSNYIDTYQINSPMSVEVIALWGTNCAFQWGERIGFHTYKTAPSKIVDIKELFSTV